MRVVKSEKRSWMALWQLQRVPRRITQALDATDCQQDHREAPWMETHNTNTHTHLCGCPPAVYWCLFHLFPLLPLFSTPRSTVLFLFPYLLFLHFPQLVPRLLFLTLYFYHFFSLTFSAVLSEQKRGHRQVTYAPIFRLLVLAFLQSHAWRRTSEEKLPLLLPWPLTPSFSHISPLN